MPAGIALYVPFAVLVNLGQQYLPARTGVASGVTLGMAASVGGLAAPLLDWLTEHAGMTQVLTGAACLPLLCALLTIRLPDPVRAAT